MAMNFPSRVKSSLGEVISSVGEKSYLCNFRDCDLNGKANTDNLFFECGKSNHGAFGLRKS